MRAQVMSNQSSRLLVVLNLLDFPDLPALPDLAA